MYKNPGVRNDEKIKLAEKDNHYDVKSIHNLRVFLACTEYLRLLRSSAKLLVT